MALPGRGFGSAMYMWALAMLRKEAAMTAMRPTEGVVLKLSMFAECVVCGKDWLRVVECSVV
jgi:hypothetical protein